jgi:hypothetical protein
LKCFLATLLGVVAVFDELFLWKENLVLQR